MGRVLPAALRERHVLQFCGIRAFGSWRLWLALSDHLLSLFSLFPPTHLPSDGVGTRTGTGFVASGLCRGVKIMAEGVQAK